MDVSASFPRRIGSHTHGSHFSQACVNQRQPDRADDEAPEKVRRPSVYENEGNESASVSVLEKARGKEDVAIVR